MSSEFNTGDRVDCKVQVFPSNATE
ncbi:hypothetical protein PIIN_10922 [Serendipita indica DSM 11827]|uniref:Uncharacterized protein n=1 Tax=Serendipita indica (strain DSM 11827) TaxID=1109443 RepID=G4U046_SERID|nr:hypothetical protein PIIN_10922 [Serendipita indica DSM 11827]